MLSCSSVKRFLAARIILCMRDVLKESLPASLLRTKRHGQRMCVEMFDGVLGWTSLSNWTGHVGERNRVMQRIIEIAGNDVCRVDELCLQILKQTRGQTRRTRERNTWKLFAEVTNSMTPSTVRTSSRQFCGIDRAFIPCRRCRSI